MVTEGVGLTRGQRAADAVTKFCGSWSLILIATLFIAAWMSGSRWFDPFPWLGLNLVFTIVEFYQGPLILMSQNRQMEQDRRPIWRRGNCFTPRSGRFGRTTPRSTGSSTCC